MSEQEVTVTSLMSFFSLFREILQKERKKDHSLFWILESTRVITWEWEWVEIKLEKTHEKRHSLKFHFNSPTTVELNEKKEVYEIKKFKSS